MLKGKISFADSIASLLEDMSGAAEQGRLPDRERPRRLTYPDKASSDGEPDTRAEGESPLTFWLLNAANSIRVEGHVSWKGNPDSDSNHFRSE